MTVILFANGTKSVTMNRLKKNIRLQRNNTFLINNFFEFGFEEIEADNLREPKEGVNRDFMKFHVYRFYLNIV
jgi:hypothetical protein